jgi:hypothetical protein
VIGSLSADVGSTGYNVNTIFSSLFDLHDKHAYVNVYMGIFDYLTVAAFAATGVPLMALAMSYIASTAIDFGDPEAAGKAINAKITGGLCIYNRYAVNVSTSYLVLQIFVSALQRSPLYFRRGTGDDVQVWA